jgi:Holliday junction resolvase-like predicted endonuclease
MLSDPAALRRLISEYGQLRRLEGHTPQSRGQRFIGLIAEVLQCWGIDARANLRTTGEIDVIFTVDGVHYVLEAKWLSIKVDTGAIAKLQKRVRQRLAGTYGVLLSMSGYSPEALAEVKDGERLEVMLLDQSHWEAMLGGQVPPARLFGLVRSYAAFHGEAYALLAELLGS